MNRNSRWAESARDLKDKNGPIHVEPLNCNLNSISIWVFNFKKFKKNSNFFSIISVFQFIIGKYYWHYISLKWRYFCKYSNLSQWQHEMWILKKEFRTLLNIQRHVIPNIKLNNVAHQHFRRRYYAFHDCIIFFIIRDGRQTKNIHRSPIYSSNTQFPENYAAQ